MSRPASNPAGLLTPGEVAALFHVRTRQVARWRKAGKLAPAGRTIGGHYRYRESEVTALLNARDTLRCDDCGYRFGTTGHRKNCGDAA
jgi:DNA-binding transcriptional MerR regulator